MQLNPNSLPKIAYSVREACAVTSIGKTALYRHISAGRLRVTRIAGRTLIPADALRAFVSGEA